MATGTMAGGQPFVCDRVIAEIKGSFDQEVHMPTVQPRYPMEEFARRGDLIYERDIEPRVGPEDRGKFVVIDIETGAYEIDINEIEATHRLRARVPDAQIWFRRVGSRYARRFGFHSRG
jgi:hypothetical protein